MGLVAGACFADGGVNVTCVDVDEAKLDKLRAGQVPFFEPHLEELVHRNWPARLGFSSNLADSIRGRQAVFVAVGTPPNEDGSADLSYVIGVAEDVARAAEHDLVLVLKSTVPVGTNELVRAAVARHARFKISVVSNPEFLKEGDAVNDFLKPDRVVVGTDDPKAAELMQRLYAPFMRQRSRLLVMTPKSAEIVKYAANALLATKISFMNEIARLCDATGGDVEHVRVALGADERIGYPFLYPGLGFGGSCFPKDLRALVRTGQEHGVPLQVTQAAVLANDEPVRDLLRHMQTDLGSLAGKTVAVWGLAFKPRTDDVREAAALRLIEGLLAAGAEVRATDPQALHTARARLTHLGLVDRVQLFADEYETARDADALVLTTEWNEYRQPDFERLAALMSGRSLFDGRNVIVPEAAADAGFDYRGVGRPRLKRRA